MEFVLISSDAANTRANDILHALATAPRMANVDGPLRFFNMGGLIAAGSMPLRPPMGEKQEETSITFWDGHGTDGAHAFSSGTHAHLGEDKANAYFNACLKGEKTNIRGVFAVARFNVNSKAFTVTVDPLWQYPLFVCRLGYTLITGNSIYLVEAAARGLGYSLTRSARSGAFEAAFGAGAGIDTGFQEVSLLAHGQTITGIGVNSRLVSTNTSGIYDHMDYDRLLDLSAERLVDYVTALKRSSTGSDLFFDLTGGLDSRLTFAAAIGAGIKKLKVFSGGSDRSTDRLIAHQIGAKYGARAVNFPHNHAGEPVTPQETAQRATFRNQGASNLYAYSLGSQRIKSAFRVRGGAGELARSFITPPTGSLIWQKPLTNFAKISRGEPVFNMCLGAHWRGVSNNSLRTAALWAYAYCNSPASHHRHYRPQFLREGTKRVLDALLQCAQTPDTMGMDFYLRDRARRHFGFLSRGVNTAYGAFEPLLDPVILAAADRLSMQERAAGKLTFDLIEKLAGRDMLHIPFSPSSLTHTMQQVLAQRLDVKEKALQYKKLRIQPLHSAAIFSGKPPNLKTITNAPRQMGKWAQSLWHNHSYFEALAHDLPTSNDYWQYIDRAQLLKTLKSQDYFLKNETTAMRGTRLLHTLIWMAGAENTTSITTAR